MQLHGEEHTATHDNNNVVVNELEAVKLRSTGSKILPNGRLSPASPKRSGVDTSSLRRDSMPQPLYDRLKTLTSVAQAAEEQIRDLKAALRETLRDNRPSLVPEAVSATSWPNGSARWTPSTTSTPNGSPKGSPPAGGGGKRQLRDKEFAVRNSVLTDLFAVSHINTIYHVAVMVLIVLVLKTLVQDLVEHGTINMSVGLIWYSFGGFHRVITIWLVMMAGLLLQYAAYAHWAARRHQLSGLLRRGWDLAFLLLLVVFDAALLTLPLLRMLHYAMPFASSFALLTEAVRVLMKSHAFVRSNVPRALRDGTVPGFNQFLYFMFAPTLVYCDSYPRTSQIRWRVVACHFLEVVGCLFYISFLTERHLLYMFRDFGLRPFTPLEGVSAVLSTVLPAGLAFMCCFYLLLHSWHNAWAEMLRFGDRMFYMDWWNQGSFSAWYRTWNVLVQDWLYTYVYKDVVLLGGNGFVARVSVFFISAAVHEFILGFALRFFYPVLYVFFGIIGFFLSFLALGSSAVGNIGLWLSLFLGDGMMFSFYAIEHYARINCQQTIDSSWDLFIPRSWSCVPLT
ncbi:Sterol O-acyltransferase 1 [Frankliniella fusca]|uniref:Sterol O-acyltransferase 1 n=1 Tax=Frankliniella fusca TaxID=407009 RepID=A0AAE1HH15_9NEOP|nr:Sterol O-acyltransferase 1 [Frankliniella fusca]